MVRHIPERRHRDGKRLSPRHQHIVDMLGELEGRGGASGWRHSVAIVVVLDEDVIDDGRQPAQRSEAVTHVRGQGKRYDIVIALTDDSCARDREPGRDVDVGVLVVHATKPVVRRRRRGSASYFSHSCKKGTAHGDDDGIHRDC